MERREVKLKATKACKLTEEKRKIRPEKKQLSDISELQTSSTFCERQRKRRSVGPLNFSINIFILV